MTRRLNHTSHHRGQQMAMLRMLGRELHSNYGPTADTGGLMQNHAPTIYAYANVDALLNAENQGGAKSRLPGAAGKIVTERPRQSPSVGRRLELRRRYKRLVKLSSTDGLPRSPWGTVVQSRDRIQTVRRWSLRRTGRRVAPVDQR